MKTNDRIEEIENLPFFDKGEIEMDIHRHSPESNFFKSIEYHLIIHLTNQELYHNQEDYETADLIEDTPKGIIFCFK